MESSVLLTVDGTYYSRNQEARQAYQRVYNELHRSSRRKVSKKVKRDMYSTKRRERRGDRSYFTHVTPGVDRDRTPDMAAQEEQRSMFYLELRGFLEEDHPDNWLEYFKDRIERDIVEQLRLVQPLLDLLRSSSADSGAHSFELHGSRRIIAGLRQELELAQQGVRAIAAAAEDKAFIWSGRRVNRRKFKQEYGW
ncbi:hypothetical protein BV25DRAFT_1920105 [Artomyces pyxidatus]|uniref:Uncharacterized protein n=1 Tax=Artomyces pyxidatus TaxID=48021 RepID=A0ACB8SP52_9AGAM|nr:hypothetical protein BV25DRAFT_1920105 [Artomyces pyxidatus]